MRSKKNIIFGIFNYQTENIGDEIQSIAARRFLPKIDIFLDRDNINGSYPDTVKNAELKVVMNGWFTHKPENWPPKIESLNPLLISMYIDQKNKKVVNAFLSTEGADFLRKFGPVGTRDKTTLKFLEENNIPAYFSGCLTLTLQRDKSLPRQGFILAVDTSEKLTRKLESLTNRQVIRVSTYYDPNLSQEARNVMAEYFLYLYQSAYCVVTTRLHSSLPSLAFETPVLLIKHKNTYEKARFDGLAELVHSHWEKDFLKDPSLYDINKPPKNKKDYLKIRKSIVKKVSEYTHHDRKESSYRTIDLRELFMNPGFIELFSKSTSSMFPRLLLEGDVSWLKRVRKAHENNEKRYKEIVAEKETVIRALSTELELKRPMYIKLAKKAIARTQLYRQQK